MPVTYQAVKDILASRVRLAYLDEITSEIDLKLSDADWLAAWRQGTRDAPYWDIAFANGKVPTQAERAALIRLYAPGWGEVSITTSEEQGERPGAWGVTFYAVQLHAVQREG